MSVQVLIRDPAGVIQGQLEVIGKVDTLQRFNQVGSWSIVCPETDLSDQLSQRGWGVSIRRDGQTLMSGPWWQSEEVRDPYKNVTISGYSDARYLWDHLAYPCNPKGDSGTIFGDSAYDVRFGPCETVMRGFVDFNNRVSAGVIPLTLQPDQLRGSHVTESARFDILGDLLSSVAIHGGGLGFDVKDYELVIYEPVDLSANAVFSVASGNLQKFTYKTTAPTATHVLVAGKGQDVSRTFLFKGNDALAQSWGRRIEFFRDRRDTDDPVQLQQSADEELTKQGEKSELSLMPIDVPNRTYGVDYGLGDVVTAEGVTGTVTELRLTLDGSGEVIMPTVSSVSSNTSGVVETLLRRYDDALRDSRRRLQALERGL